MTDKEFKVHLCVAWTLIVACLATMDVWPFGFGGPLAVVFLGLFTVESLVLTLRLLLT